MVTTAIIAIVCLTGSSSVVFASNLGFRAIKSYLQSDRDLRKRDPQGRDVQVQFNPRLPSQSVMPMSVAGIHVFLCSK